MTCGNVEVSFWGGLDLRWMDGWFQGLVVDSDGWMMVRMPRWDAMMMNGCIMALHWRIREDYLEKAGIG